MVVTKTPVSCDSVGDENTTSWNTNVASYEIPRFGGNDGLMDEMREIIWWPKKYGKEMRRLDIHWPKGILLHGPPGTGKTLLVKCLAQEMKAKLFLLSSSNAFGAFAGESEKKLRDAFQQATEEARNGQDVLLFLDELDTLCPKRDNRQHHSSRFTAQLLTLLDHINQDAELHLPVVAATNHPNEIDPALRRAGRFDREIAIGPPDLKSRREILSLHLHKLPLENEGDLEVIARRTSGFTGADLAALSREAAIRMLHFVADANQECKLTLQDFELALSKIKPSLARGSALDHGDVKWTDIGGLEDVKNKLQRAIEWPFKHHDAFARLNIKIPTGVLLYGPPGCSKTTMARAAAKASGANFIPLSCADLFSMYMGEGEEWLRVTFSKARLAAPSIIFLDEFDAIGGKRKGARNHGGGVDAGARLLSTLLTEMDGLESSRGVIVLGATNRPETIDAALMRPGRLDVLLYVPPPDRVARMEAFRIHTRQKPLSADVELGTLADLSEGYTGADIEGICREAAFSALREDIDLSKISMHHFMKALKATEPSIDRHTIQFYEQFNS